MGKTTVRIVVRNSIGGKMTDLVAMSDNISRNALLKELERIAEIHPYKVVGDHDSYSPYNEAWEDCISLIEERLQFLPSAERKAKVIDSKQFYKGVEYGTCSACGAPVVESDKYCSQCGARLEWE